MNEGDFDKKISEKLKDDHTNYPDMDKNWQKVVKKLAENPPSKPTAGGVIVLPNSDIRQKSSLVPWLLSGLLLLLGSNGWLFWRLLEANNSPKTVVSERNVLPQTVRLYDTIVETKVIYKIDTIYKKVIVSESYLTQNNNSFGSNAKDNDGIRLSILPSPQSARGDASTVFTPNSDMKQPQSNTQMLPPTNSDKKTSTIKDKETTNSTRTKTILEAPNTSEALKTDKNTTDKNTNTATTDAPNTTTNQKTNEQTDNKTAISHILQDGAQQNKDTIEQNHLPITGTFAQSHTNTDSLNDYQLNLSKPKTDSVKFAAVPYDSLEMKPQQGLNEHIIIKPSRKKLVINHYGIGLQGGTSWELPKLSGVENGYWLGLTNEIAVNKHLRLSVSGDYMSFHYKALTRSTLHAIPNDPPMTENYDLKYIESTTPSVLMGLNVSYFFET